MVDKSGRKELSFSWLFLSYMLNFVAGIILDLWVVMVSYFSIRVLYLFFSIKESSSYSYFDLILSNTCVIT